MPTIGARWNKCLRRMWPYARRRMAHWRIPRQRAAIREVRCSTVEEPWGLGLAMDESRALIVQTTKERV